ncbi:MAG: hypothetical protein ACJ759_01940 [Thermoanaerobaculia bacterium]
MRSKIALVALILAAVSMTGSAVTREEAFGVRAARIVAALEAQPELVAAARAAAIAATAPDQTREKAVSKVDKNSFTLIGNVFFYDTDFLSDGTPITVGVADVRRPAQQDIYFSCIGSLAATCRALGRRQLDGWLLAGDGVNSDEYLHFLIVTKVKK